MVSVEPPVVFPNIGAVDFSLMPNIELPLGSVELPKIPTDGLGVLCNSFLNIDVFWLCVSLLPISLSWKD